MDEKKKRILLVEDDDDVKYITKKMLEKFNYNVVTASNGKVALNLFNETYDVVLTDIVMPEMNGIELINEIRKIDPEMTCLAFTGYPNIEIPSDIPIMYKPLYISNLNEFIQSAMN